MNKRIKTLLSLAVMGVVAVAVLPLSAATMSASPTAPEIDNLDIANLVTGTGTDKWFNDTKVSGRPKGQTFTTGSENVLLHAVTFQTSSRAAGIKTYIVRVCTVNRVDPANSSTWELTEIYSETGTQDFEWNPGEYMTWRFDFPVMLLADKEYAFDVGMRTTTTTWDTGGIPYIYRTGDVYAGGTRYMSGTAGLGLGDTTMNNVGYDMVFHLDMTPSDPTLPDVVIDTPDKATWTGQEIALDATVTNNAGDPNFPEAQPPLVYSWTAEPNGIGNDDLDVVITNADAEDASITIIKNTNTGDVLTVKVTLSVVNEGVDKIAMTDSMTIDVYDNACLMGKDLGLIELDKTDMNGDCVTNLADFALLAMDWMYDYAITAPVEKY